MTALRTLISHSLCSALLLASAPATAQTRVWDFQVFLNDSPIGTHRFTLSGEGAAREMTIEARFEVKALFITVYRYAHDAKEVWRGDCLDILSARTNDDGRQLTTDTTREGERMAVSATGGRAVLDGCVMTFAYWNPAILRQPRLLNAQTGEYEGVKIAVVGDETVAVRGTQVPAKHYRITGPKNPIDLWYSTDNEWLALESTVEGGRRLRYKLK